MVSSTKVYESAVIPAPIEAVWALVGHFERLAEWLPAIRTCELKGGVRAETVGAMRELTTPDGARLTELQISRSDAERTYSYAMTETPLPFHNYRSTIRLKPVTATGETFFEWFSSFEPEAGKQAEMVALITSVYQSGLGELARRFKQGKR